MFVPTADPLAGYKYEFPQSVVAKFHSAGFSVAEDHLHEVAIFCVFYTLVYLASSVLSPFVVPAYNKLSTRNKANFDIHVVSQVNCLFVLAASLPLFYDKGLDSLESYSPYAGFVVSSLIGYFVWDLLICMRYSVLFGPAFSLHAAAALFVFAQGLRPFLYNVSAAFIWFEASTPFVNVHWFASHVPGLISPKLFMINGLALIVVFFLCRIVSGPINGFLLFKDLVYNYPQSIPKWVAWGVFGSYLSLMALNFFWFEKMIAAALAQVKKKAD